MMRLEITILCCLITAQATRICDPHVKCFNMCSKTIFEFKLWVTFTALIRLSLMNWLLMSSEAALKSCLENTFPALILLSYMNWLVMCGKIALCSSLVITFAALKHSRKNPSFMNWMLMSCETLLKSWLENTFSALKLLSVMNCLLMCGEIAFLSCLEIKFPTQIFLSHVYLTLGSRVINGGGGGWGGTPPIIT